MKSQMKAHHCGVDVDTGRLPALPRRGETLRKGSSAHRIL